MMPAGIGQKKNPSPEQIANQAFATLVKDFIVIGKTTF